MKMIDFHSCDFKLQPKKEKQTKDKKKPKAVETEKVISLSTAQTPTTFVTPVETPSTASPSTNRVTVERTCDAGKVLSLFS